MTGSAYLDSIIPNAQPVHRESVSDLDFVGALMVAWENRNETSSGSHRIRRIYNLVLGMVMSGIRTFGEVRGQLLYVNVLKDSDYRRVLSVPNEDPTGVMTSLLSSLVGDAWEYDPVEINRYHIRVPIEYKLTGLICKKAYLVYERELEDFKHKKGLV